MLKAQTLRAAGYDPRIVSGFAFGFGLERMAMFTLGIKDIRDLWQPPYIPR
jgi:phenylalanyl-tRNA synthetase alpha chain